MNFLPMNQCASVLSEAGGRGLGMVISKFKAFKGCRYKTFSTLYNTGVVPIFSYGSGIWGYKRGCHAEKIQNRAIRYFLGISKFSPNLFLQGDSGWLLITFNLTFLNYGIDFVI